MVVLIMGNQKNRLSSNVGTKRAKTIKYIEMLPRRSERPVYTDKSLDMRYISTPKRPVLLKFKYIVIRIQYKLFFWQSETRIMESREEVSH